MSDETLFEVLAEDEAPPKVSERDMAMALHDRYGARFGNGARYVVAEQVRSHAGFDARRTADFMAMDLWPSKGLGLHGHEIKVSRSDWLNELKHPEKAGEFIPYTDYWWLVIADKKMVRDGELPVDWGMMALRGGLLAVIKPAPRRKALPLPPTRLAALLRAVAATSAAVERRQLRRGR